MSRRPLFLMLVLVTLAVVMLWSHRGASEPISSVPYKIVPIDSSGNGHKDLLISFDHSGGIANRLMLVDFRADPPRVIRSIPFGSRGAMGHNMATGDIDRDGFEDIAVATHRPYVAVLRNRAGQGFERSQQFATHDTVQGVRLADLNGDGWLDLIASKEHDQGWVERKTYRLLHDLLRIPTERIPAFSFLNRRPAGRLCIWLGTGGGRFGHRHVIDASPKAYMVAAADLDLDGDVDLVTPHEATNQISVFLNSGDGISWERRQYATTGDRANHVAIAELNGDAYPDLAVANWGGIYDGVGRSSLSIFFGGPDGFSQPLDIPTLHSSCWVKSADLDRDGDTDLVVSNWLTSLTSVLLNDGTGHFTMEHIKTAAGNYGLYLDDLDGDGIVDLLTAGFQDHSLALLRGLGNGQFAPPRRMSADQQLAVMSGR